MHPRTACSFASILACIAAAGCPQNAKDKEKSPAPLPVAQVKDLGAVKAEEPKDPSKAETAKWGTIAGRIIWDGTIPEAKAIDIRGNAGCAKHVPIQDETWVVNPKSKGLKNCFVWLAPKDPKDKKAKLPIHADFKDPPKESVVVDQPACAFLPHAVGVRQGQSLIVKNSADVAHNFKYTGNPEFEENTGNPLLAPKSEKALKFKADRLPILMECNIHPWMRGYIRVFDHPYFAVTDADGKFEIKNAPIGEYRLMIWHGSGGWAGGAKGRDGTAIEVKEKTDLGDLAYPVPE
jgi:hypothetical protein